MTQPQTWHHGLVARWWAEFNDDGPEIAYFRRFVEAGQPALDVGCGTGRLLLAFSRDGLDVDGTTSEDLANSPLTVRQQVRSRVARR